MSHDFMGLEGETVPEMDDEFLNLVTSRYIELYEKITGSDFKGDSSNDPLVRIEKAVEEWLAKK
jgi:phosphoribosylaminoimidazole-succinocarboxamide synthase